MSRILHSPLARAIAILLAAKAMALFAIWWAFFRHPVIPSMIQGLAPDQVGTAVLGRAPAENR